MSFARVGLAVVAVLCCSPAVFAATYIIWVTEPDPTSPGNHRWVQAQKQCGPGGGRLCTSEADAHTAAGANYPSHGRIDNCVTIASKDRYCVCAFGTEPPRTTVFPVPTGCFSYAAPLPFAPCYPAPPKVCSPTGSVTCDCPMFSPAVAPCAPTRGGLFPLFRRCR